MKTAWRFPWAVVSLSFLTAQVEGAPVRVGEDVDQQDAIQMASHSTNGLGIVYTKLNQASGEREVYYANVIDGLIATSRVDACQTNRYYYQIPRVIPVAVAFDPLTGRPAVTYSSTNQELVFAEADGLGAWQKAVVAAWDGTECGTLAFDPNTAGPAIARNTTSDYNLCYAYRDAGVWTNEVLSSDDASWESLRFSPLTGATGISYQALGWTGNPSSLGYIGAEGTFDSIDTGPASEGFLNGNSLAYDSSGLPHITYFSSNGLKHAWWDSAAWNVEIVETNVTGGYTALVASTNNELFVSYATDNPAGAFWPDPIEVKLARYDGSNWAVRALAAGPGISTWTSAALDSNGSPVVACIMDGQALLLSDAFPPLRPTNAVSRAEVDSFINHSGVNLPWINYGHDIGASPYGPHDGFSDNRAALEEDFAYLQGKLVKLCRVFLFGDFRTGLVYTNGGDVAGLDGYVRADMRTLVDVARTYNIGLVPVIMDFHMADGISVENGNPVGEHPEFITNAIVQAQWMTNALAPLVREFGTDTVIYAWDIMNEPSLATNVPQPLLRNFIEACAALITNELPGARVCFGNFDRKNLRAYGGAACNLSQVHYYDYMESTAFPYVYRYHDRPAISVSRQPVLVGEAQPTNVAHKLASGLANRYEGVLFWSLNGNDGYSFAAVADTYRDWISAQAGSPWDGAVDVGGGWKWLAWFGYFKDGSGAWGGWIWHAEHGWLYPFGTSPANVWLWDLNMRGWLWTNDSLYPFLWSDALHSWLWYYRGTGNGSGGWFYNYGAGRPEWR